MCLLIRIMAPSLQTIRHGNSKVDPVIATALLDAGLNNSQVAAKLQVNQSTISRFAEKYKDNQIIKRQVQVFTDNLHNILVESMAEANYAKVRGLRYFNRMDDESYSALPDHIKTATINSGNVSFGVDFDKDRLVMGLSTSNVDLHAEFESLKQLRDAKQALRAVCSGDISCSDRDGEAG